MFNNKKTRILVVILGVILIATISAYVIVTPDMRRARLRLTEKNMEKIVEQLESCNISPICPDIDKNVVRECIKEKKYIIDAWGNTMEVECYRKKIQITSAGPDRVFQNQDDIKRPE